MYRILPTLFLLSALTACYEPQEGCLDIEAVNFNAAADEDCCCEYPDWTVAVSPVYIDGDTQAYLPGDARQTPEGRWFRVQRFVFYLSEFQARQGAALWTVSDTVNVRVFSGQDTVPVSLTDDIMLFNFPTLAYTLGEFRPLGVFDSIRLRVGLGEPARRTAPGTAPAGHPLRIQSDQLWQNPSAGYLVAKMILQRDSAALTPSDTLHFRAADVGDVFIAAAGPFLHASATNFDTRLQLDYRKLLAGVDFSVYDTTAWKQKIVGNLQNAFSFGQ